MEYEPLDFSKVNDLETLSLSASILVMLLQKAESEDRQRFLGWIRPPSKWTTQLLADMDGLEERMTELG